MTATRSWLLAIVSAASVLAGGCGPARDGAPALFDYVAADDASYSWELIAHETVDAAEIVELRLHSQTWRGLRWRHRLFLLKPSRLSTGRQALLVLSGGRWRPEYDEPEAGSDMPEDLETFVAIAEAMETMFVVLEQVPFQPLFDLTEDDLIAHTFEQFLNSGEADWPLLLPMVKSAVRALDASQQAAEQLWDIDLETFTVLGGSKRGWTTWLTAAADRRVTAIAPIVIDALNMQAHFPHQTEVWGAPSEKIRPYTVRNLHNIMSSAAGRELREIVDPFAYRERLSLPKLIVNATNDEYFPLDSVNLYWSGLPGDKYALYLPNEGHDIDDLLTVVATVNAFHRSAAGLAAMPQLEWEYQLDEAIVRLCLKSDPAPSAWRIWIARSDDRDFRDARWTHIELGAADTNAVTYEHAREMDAYASLYAEPVFLSGDDEFTLTTTPAVVSPAGRGSRVWSAAAQGRGCD